MKGMAAWMASVSLAGQLALVPPVAAQDQSPLGQWRGTSICLPVEGNGACKNEVVWYDFTPSKETPGGLTLDAWKFVGDQWEDMFGMEFRHVPAHRDWEGEFQNSRVHIVWKFLVTDSGLVGWVEDVPGGLKRRDVHARRARKPPIPVKQEVAQALAEYAGFIQTMSGDSIASRFTPDGVSQDGNSAPLVGPNAIRSHLAQFTDYKVLRARLDPDSIRVSFDSAWSWGKYWQRVKVPKGDTVEVSGSFATTWLFSSARGWLVRRMVTEAGGLPSRPSH